MSVIPFKQGLLVGLPKFASHGSGLYKEGGYQLSLI